MDARQQAMAQVRGVYEDGVAEINGREYKYLAMQHLVRRKVFAFYTSVQHQLQAQSFAFLDTPEYAAVEKTMFDCITFEGSLVSKLRDHWEQFPEDYLQLVSVSMGVMSYPFLRGNPTDSASQADVKTQTTFGKPM